MQNSKFRQFPWAWVASGSDDAYHSTPHDCLVAKRTWRNLDLYVIQRTASQSVNKKQFLSVSPRVCLYFRRSSTLPSREEVCRVSVNCGIFHQLFA